MFRASESERKHTSLLSNFGIHRPNEILIEKKQNKNKTIKNAFLSTSHLILLQPPLQRLILTVNILCLISRDHKQLEISYTRQEMLRGTFIRESNHFLNEWRYIGSETLPKHFNPSLRRPWFRVDQCSIEVEEHGSKRKLSLSRRTCLMGAVG